MQRDNWSLTGGLIAAIALVSLGFATTHQAHSERVRIPADPPSREVKIKFLENNEIPPRRVTPLRSRDERTAPLNRDTPFIAKKENPWSGQNAELTESWAEAQAGDQMPSEPGADQALSEVQQDIFHFDKKVFSETHYAPDTPIRDYFAPFQELPLDLRPDASLLINFKSSGQVSLGSYAHENAEYFFEMVKKIQARWMVHFPKFQHFYGLLKAGEVFLTIELDLDGRVNEVRVIRSYGQSAIDESCVRAIRDANNFGPIPKEFREKGKMIVPFVFVYQRPNEPLKLFH